MSENEKSIKLDFSGLILGFSSAALYHLGKTEVDQKKVAKANFDLAEQNIEIISMLAEKTQGNLTTSERKLIENVLKDLELKHKEAKRASEPK